MRYYDTLRPYKVLEYNGIQYTTCRDYSHISRYRGLRQVIHSPTVPEDRILALETANPFTTSNTSVLHYEVTGDEANRLDIIANNTLGSAQYAWIIAYFNNIEDGYTVRQGQKLKIPKSVYDLFNSGEILQSVSPYMLNLGSE